MDGLALAPCFLGGRTPATVAAGRQLLSRPSKRLVVVVAAQGSGGKDEEQGADEGSLDKWEQMELKVDQHLGEDPNLSMAKHNVLTWIMARKKNPGVSMLDVEKQFKRERGKMVKIKELPFDVPQRLKNLSNSTDGADLVRPVPTKGVQFDTKYIKEPEKPANPAASASKRSVPGESLRKPALYLEDRPKKPSSRVRITPKLTLKMSKDQRSTETFRNITFLRKPKPSIVGEKEDKVDIALLKKPEAVKNGSPNSVEVLPGPIAHYGGDAKGRKKEVEEETRDDSMTGMQPDTLGTIALVVRDALVGELSDPALNDSAPVISVETALQEKPRRLNPSPEEDSTSTKRSSIVVSSGNYDSADDLKNILPLSSTEDRDVPFDEQSDPTLSDSAPPVSLKTALQEKPRRLDPSAEEDSTSTQKSSVVVSSESYDVVDDLKDILPSSATENVDWTRAENLVKAGGIEEVDIIIATQRGYGVSFGSLVGFLPYRNLTARWRFLEFESWLRQKGLDPSRYREIPLIGSYYTVDKNPLSSFINGTENNRQNPVEVTADMNLRDLQSIYDQEKHSFFFSFVGQSIRVNVVMADRKLKKLIVSMKPRVNDEALQKKRNLMAKLKIGDFVKCCIKKITDDGIFVEIEDVSALVHPTEISWDATLDAVSYYKVGQIVEAKVMQLDFPLERIYLSLKETMPDPLSKTFNHLGGERDPADGRVEAADRVAEWPEVDSLIEELQQIERVQTVSKGCLSWSPALAPTFQVYMASTYNNRYKLLARAGNKVQEVIVQASLSKEEMASTILSCAARLK